MATRPFKRPRVVVSTPARRPIDKSIIAVSQAPLNTADSTTLLTATIPCTVLGIRWSLDYSLGGTATAGAAVYWAIVIVREGQTAVSFTTTDGGTLYKPEGDALVWGSCIGGTNGTLVTHWEGHTATMRKLMAGDTMTLRCRSSDNSAGQSLIGAVQFFCKF